MISNKIYVIWYDALKLLERINSFRQLPAPEVC